VLSNYGIGLDEITAQLIVDTSDKKRHIYGVPFNPLVQGHPFEFYMVNKCSFGVVPVMAQWGDRAEVRIIGEEHRKRPKLTVLTSEGEIGVHL
jgi:hypothetical protein